MMTIKYSAVAIAVTTSLLTFSSMSFSDDLGEANANAIAELQQQLAEQQKNTETIAELKQELATQKDEAVQWNGYFRAGFTSNEEGSASGNATIQAPNAGAFYRLGGGKVIMQHGI